MSWPDYSDEDELDIRIHRRSPAPVYPEYRRPHVQQPVQYVHGGGLVIPSGSGRRRSSSGHSVRSIRQEFRHEAPPPQQLQPVVINNRIYNDYEDEPIIDPRDRYLIPHHSSSRSRSHSRPTSFSTHDWELEKARRELEDYRIKEEQHRLKEENERELERYKKEIELKKLKEDKAKKEQAAKQEAAEKEAIEKFKAEEAKKREKEKKEKEEREKEYKLRMEEDLRKSGVDEQQIAVIMKKEGAKKPQQALEPARPTYTRMSRRHLSLETLRVHRIEYEFDVVRAQTFPDFQISRTNEKQDDDYVLIRRWVPEYEQDFLWEHTRKLRETRQHHHHPQTVVYAIEAKKKKHEEPELEWVRKKEKRKPSPSPLLTFLAGGKGR